MNTYRVFSLVAALIVASPVGANTIVCSKKTGENVPKKLVCNGTEFYRSHDAIGLTAALLLERRCGERNESEEFDSCQTELLKEVTRNYDAVMQSK